MIVVIMDVIPTKKERISNATKLFVTDRPRNWIDENRVYTRIMGLGLAQSHF